MAHARRFRFGVQLSAADSPDEWLSKARRAEELGYSTLFMPDHFTDQYGPFAALTAAAGATEDLRVGTLVFDNDYRHPVVLAKECATIDVVSGGRLELGLGAGWMTSDYTESGIPLDEPRVRVDRMVEGLAILKGAFGEAPFTHKGEHYTVTDYDGLPLPTQQPHPPMLIGGGGRRVLSIAAQEADIVGINPSIPNGVVDADAARTGLAEQTDRKVSWIREAAGDRYDDLELNMLTYANVLTDDRQGTLEMMAPMFGVDPAEVSDYPHAWVGTVDEICADLEARRERWDVSYLVVQGDAMEDMAPVVARLTGT